MDLVLYQGVVPGELSVRQISGRGLPANKGKLDTILGRRELAKSLADYIKEHGLSDALHTKIMEWHVGIDVYRTQMGCVPKVALSGYSPPAAPDHTWVATLGGVGQGLLQLWEVPRAQHMPALLVFVS